MQCITCEIHCITHTYTHTCIHTHTYIHSLTQTHSLSLPHSLSQTHTTHTHVHTSTYTHSRIHIQTNTYTYTPNPSPVPLSSMFVFESVFSAMWKMTCDIYVRIRIGILCYVEDDVWHICSYSNRYSLLCGRWRVTYMFVFVIGGSQKCVSVAEQGSQHRQRWDTSTHLKATQLCSREFKCLCRHEHAEALRLHWWNARGGVGWGGSKWDYWDGMDWISGQEAIWCYP